MDRLLIVEDEKLIRQGLKSMIQRSGLPIGEILECRNGEEALALLHSTHVDVMFTDVRMPRMDGLTLIRKIQEEVAQKPAIVVISGYDDFNYAVEAMRYGSREYILKPVERSRVHEILVKLERVVQEKKALGSRQDNLAKISRQQLKYMLLNPQITDEEVRDIKSSFSDMLVSGAYVVICQRNKIDLPCEEVAVQLENIGAFNVIVVPDIHHRDFIARRLSDFYVGVSAAHSDLSDFRVAFEEAAECRKSAFFTSRRVVTLEDLPPVSDQPLTQTPAQLARQLGSKDYGKLVPFFHELLGNASRSKVSPAAFESFILEFLDLLAQRFGSQLRELTDKLADLRAVYGFSTIDSYRLALFDWLDLAHIKVHSEIERSKTHARMQEAIAYIDENFGKNLNMAIVSNSMSINYSVFSQTFKEYTGKNFVDYLRDLRIAKAKSLLADTELKISEISALTGYTDDKYFMKAFKAAVGVSPTQFRKTERLDGPS